jgi:hypothetical protein
VGSRVSIVAFGEVAVKRGNDGVSSLRIIAMAFPLADAGAAGIGHHYATDISKIWRMPSRSLVNRICSEPGV